jgi:hypothetical protein
VNFFKLADDGLTAMASPTASQDATINRAVDALYGVYFGLHVLDAHSTARALRKGATEANVFLASMMGMGGNISEAMLGHRHPEAPIAMMVGVKVVAAAATVACTEVVRRKNPSAALGLMVVIDAVYAGTVLHNYSIV